MKLRPRFWEVAVCGKHVQLTMNADYIQYINYILEIDLIRVASKGSKCVEKLLSIISCSLSHSLSNTKHQLLGPTEKKPCTICPFSTQVADEWIQSLWASLSTWRNGFDCFLTIILYDRPLLCFCIDRGQTHRSAIRRPPLAL